MDDAERREIVEMALGESVNLHALKEQCREYITTRRCTLLSQLQIFTRSNVRPLIERARTRLRQFDRGMDFSAAFHSIAAQTLGDIADILEPQERSTPGRQALAALRDADIPPLRENINVPEDFNVRQEICSMIAQRLTMRAMDAYEEKHNRTIADPDSELLFKLSQEVQQTLEAEG